ncbi:MAG: ADP-ribosylation factor-like protein [Asgard group archaeon]|nr:ADP-ribosylation factor-like protein [Asgard group archaeon]
MLIHKYRNIQSIKICFWGPSLSGKTYILTAIKIMKSLENPKEVIDFVKVADQDTGRTVFFDQAVFGFGKKPDSDDFLFKIHIFTTAGQKRLRETRKVVLQGIRGLVLVLDGALDQWENNIWSLQELKKLKGEEIIQKNIPYTILINKQDLPWGTRFTHRHVSKLLKAAEVDDVFSNPEPIIFRGSCLKAKQDLESLLRNLPRSVLLDEKGLFKKEFRPESFSPFMKTIESIIKQVIKQQLKASDAR